MSNITYLFQPLCRIVRTEVPPGLISWEIPFDTYDTISITAPHLKTAPWADPDMDDENFKPKWNEIDGQINRKSHDGLYMVNARYNLGW